MPRQNGTGPMGQGAGTGRGFGPCGRGLRRGYGFGFRRFFSSKNELEALAEEEKILEEELEIIKKEKTALMEDKK
jgi:hypothetical protein